MPFKSEKQRRYLWAEHPDIAQKWSDEYGSKPQPDRASMKALKNKKSHAK